MGHCVSEEGNIAVVRRWIEEGWNQRDPDLIDELFSPDFVVRGGPNGFGDIEHYKHYVCTKQDAFPDFHFEIRDCIAAGDIVVITYRVTGTHSRAYGVHEPTGRQLDTVVIDLWSVVDGCITERLNTEFSKNQIENQLGFDPIYVPD